MKEEFIKNNKRPFAFVTMCADPIHHGHINILHEAKKYGSVIVGLMTDSAMKNYKGNPLLSFQERLKVLAELKSVSGIIPIESIDFVPYLEKFEFEYFLHGDDWKQGVQKKSRESAILAMSEWGGKVIDVPYTEGVSSSGLKKGIN